MKRQEFIDALYKAGWEAVHDAQWTEIDKLWRELFPVIAELESELEQAVMDLQVLTDECSE